MFYRTYYIAERLQTPQFSIEDLYAGCIPENTNTTEAVSTKTIRVSNIPARWLEESDRLNTVLSNFFNLNANVEIAYTEYHIPKATGGYRLIAAPTDELKDCLRELLKILERFGAAAHNCAHAYIKQRDCLTAIQQHQAAKTQWFYKFDLDSFFPSCTTQLLEETLSYVYPFCIMSAQNLRNLIRFATYHKALPQGSPLSPLLSNIVLTSFDWAMYYSIRHFNGIYTRYADDVLISFPTKKQLSFVENIVQGHLPNGLRLNQEKSRCGSVAGRNYNLGLVLNKENNITIGHKKKMKLKAKLNNFIFDFTNQRYWSIIDTQVLQGELNYFKSIEPEYAQFVIKRLEQKHHSPSISSMFSDIIARRV